MRNTQADTILVKEISVYLQKSRDGKTLITSAEEVWSSSSTSDTTKCNIVPNFHITIKYRVMCMSENGKFVIYITGIILDF